MHMHKILTGILLIVSSFCARAQVVILNDNVLNGRMSEIKTTVVDSLTNEPISFASVYLIPSKDTTISNFTLTDQKGEAKLDEVPYGSYVFRVEMMGYKPFVKERYFRESQVDMGTIRLMEDEQYLQAASITDVGNPIIIKKDTVEFNASSFHVGTNSMLKDLLQRMPGMEITSAGKVKFNGEEIDKLTIGGRTFFFNDQSTALNNLPAAIVDKIRVIDRESEQTRASGIQDGKKEKVLDVGLKKEYEKGWFGNVGLKGGTTLGNKNDNNTLKDNRGLLFNTNALVSAYGEKDQATVIANGLNIDDSNTVVVVVDEDGDHNRMNQGLSTAAQLGINVNTMRIKDTETTFSTNYKYSNTDSGTKTERTTYQDNGNLTSSTESTGNQYTNALNANLEMKKEKGKVWFHARPSFHFNKTNSYSQGISESFRAGSFVNKSTNSSNGWSDMKDVKMEADVTIRQLWGKKNRTIIMSTDIRYGTSAALSDDSSFLETIGSHVSKKMKYDTDSRSLWLEGGVRYTEPLGEKWAISTAADYTWSKRSSIRDAFDNTGKNDYYSSESRTYYTVQKYDLTAQYRFGQSGWITLGGSVYGVNNETFSKSYNVDNVTGKGEWQWSVTPNLRFQVNDDINRFQIYLYGYNKRPSSSQILPVLNISNPTRISLGNVYLKPSTQSFLYTTWMRNNKKRFSTLMVFLSGNYVSNPTSYAQWYDSDGVLYSIPENAKKPSLNVSFTLNYTTPLDAKKNWSMTLNASADYSSSVSYQAASTLAAVDKDSFDYSVFMSDFWGNAEGDRFYGGLSGFRESKTRTFNPYAGLSVKYNQKQYSFSVGANTQVFMSSYSLDPNIDMNTLDTRIFARGSYTTKYELELNTDLTYAFFSGYAAGYGLPEWRWNGGISKNIGAFNLSIKLYDILNQTRKLTHTVTANYEEDTYRLCMGRYILLGVRWNFGKMGATHSARARQAAMNMIW